MAGRLHDPSRREGASHSRARLADRYRAWQHHHSLSAADSLLRVLTNPWSSVLTWLVIGIAIALPVGLNVALDNAREISASWDSPTQISLFLAEDIDLQQAEELEVQWRGREGVVDTQLVSAEDALREFGALSGFADIMADLDKNPLPHLILLSPQTDLSEVEVEALRDELQHRPEVAEAVLDMAWLQRLNQLVALSRSVVLVLGVLLVLGIVLILGNTIRLAIESRREEIVIVKLVGGSHAFVRRPFLYTGLWYGVGGGLMAGLLLSAALWYLQAPVGNLARLYYSDFQLQGLGVMGVLNLVVLGGGLGIAGAWLAVTRHLVAIEPT
ncbi:MAG: permease-like cell division protein FtsX [Pseudomonadota bacterium]